MAKNSGDPAFPLLFPTFYSQGEKGRKRGIERLYLVVKVVVESRDDFRKLCGAPFNPVHSYYIVHPCVNA